MANLIVDTDVCIDHLRGTRELKSSGDYLWYSVVTRAELFVGGDEKRVRGLLDGMGEVPVDRAVADRAGRVRRATGIRLPDALIAASALERGYALLTRNLRDFEKVKGLRVREPGADR